MSRIEKKLVAILTNPSLLTGPVFGKELRVSSRRKRNYLLRSIYLFLLTVFVGIVWSSSVDTGYQSQVSAAYIASRMAAAAVAIVSTIVIFQFVATQIVAVIMLSTAISDEIYNKTLGALMSTPVNSFQIVTGKLLSKLLQVMILIAVTLPLLAVVRVFGGVPWPYIFSSVCITFTAIVFAGSLSLYFSISISRAYAVILKTVFTLAVFYTFIPAIMTMLFVRSGSFAGPVIMFLLVVTNPFYLIMANTETVVGSVSPLFKIPTASYIWPLHCAFMLGVSALILARSMIIVRKVALRQATGSTEVFVNRLRRKKTAGKATSARSNENEHFGSIRDIHGPPVIWKELRKPIILGGPRAPFIAAAMTILALAFTYVVCIREDCLHKNFCHVVYIIAFMILALTANIVLAATSITSEKESRSWPLLLATSMDDYQILTGKAVGIFRRCLPIWSLLAGHVVLFVICRYIHPIAIIHLAFITVWAVIFLTGMGIYFSALCKRSTSAVVATLAFAILLWGIIPAMLGLMMTTIHSDKPFLIYMSTNPIIQAGIIMSGASGQYNANVPLGYLKYPWPEAWMKGTIGNTTMMVLATTAIYVCAGLFFAWRAKCRFRKKIF